MNLKKINTNLKKINTNLKKIYAAKTKKNLSSLSPFLELMLEDPPVTVPRAYARGLPLSPFLELMLEVSPPSPFLELMLEVIKIGNQRPNAPMIAFFTNELGDERK